jgi:hypothetical protein
MDKPIEQSPIHLSLEEVAVRAGHKVLMEVDDNILPIVAEPQGDFSPTAQWPMC